MVTLPRQRVQEVHLKCRFCAYQHFNTRSKGTIDIPGQIIGKDNPEIATGLSRYTTYHETNLWEKCPKLCFGTVKDEKPEGQHVKLEL